MAADPVTPIAGLVSVVATGGSPVVAIGPLPNGGVITNPVSVSDQGIPGDIPENLYVDPVANATNEGNGTTFALAPGQSWTVIPGQTTPTSVNAPTSGHKFAVVSY